MFEAPPAVNHAHQAAVRMRSPDVMGDVMEVMLVNQAYFIMQRAKYEQILNDAVTRDLYQDDVTAANRDVISDTDSEASGGVGGSHKQRTVAMETVERRQQEPWAVKRAAVLTSRRARASAVAERRGLGKENRARSRGVTPPGKPREEGERLVPVQTRAVERLFQKIAEEEITNNPDNTTNKNTNNNNNREGHDEVSNHHKFQGHVMRGQGHTVQQPSPSATAGHAQCPPRRSAFTNDVTCPGPISAEDAPEDLSLPKRLSDVSEVARQRHMSTSSAERLQVTSDSEDSEIIDVITVSPADVIHKSRDPPQQLHHDVTSHGNNTTVRPCDVIQPYYPPERARTYSMATAYALRPSSGSQGYGPRDVVTRPRDVTARPPRDVITVPRSSPPPGYVAVCKEEFETLVDSVLHRMIPEERVTSPDDHVTSPGSTSSASPAGSPSRPGEQRGNSPGAEESRGPGNWKKQLMHKAMAQESRDLAPTNQGPGSAAAAANQGPSRSDTPSNEANTAELTGSSSRRKGRKPGRKKK